MELSSVALDIAQKRYFMNGETWEDCCRRIGRVISQCENNPKEWEDKFAEIIFNGDFIPGGRVLRNVGRPRGSLFNCYAIELGDSIESIGECKKNALILWAEGGGVGLSFSPLRPKGTSIKGKGGESSGLVSFVRATNGDALTIESGGQRRAAALALVDVEHPEVVDFINAKLKGGELSCFNISVGINESFLEGVENDVDWELKFAGRVYETVKARDIWDLILTNMVGSAEPGLINMDNLTKNNSYYFSPIVATNPCIHGSTLISTTIGEVPIKELTRYKKVDVYCMLEDGTLGIREATDIRRTKTKAKLITVKTGKGSIKTTPEHLFYVKNKGWTQAKDLIYKDLLVGLSKQMANERGVNVGLNGCFCREHRMIAEYYYGDLTDKDVHHIDNNPRNNVIQNLQVLPHWVHSKVFNVGHVNWNQQDISNGQFLKKEERKKKDSLAFINPNGKDGKNWRVIEVIDEEEYAPVFNMEVSGVHNFIANGMVVHNCGEVPLGNYECCNLGAITLPHYVPGVYTNWSKMEEVIELAIRMLDNVIDVNRYALQLIEQRAKAARRIGLGTMGLADYLFKKQVGYNSSKGISETERVFKFIRDKAYETSIKLAMEKGTFPKYDQYYYNKAYFIRSLPATLRMDIKKHGIRNTTLLSQAPTGCLVGETLVPSSIGIKSINNYDYRTRINTNIEERTVELLCDFGKSFAKRWFDQGYANTIKITTHMGYEIEGTEDHKIRIISDCGGYTWKKFSDIQMGDIAVLKKGSYLEKECSYSKYMAELVGLYMADGFWDKEGTRLSFCIHQKEIEYVKKLWGKCSGTFKNAIPRIYKSDSSLGCKVCINSTVLYKWFRKHNSIKDGAPNAFIPEFVLCGSKEVIKYFIRGYLFGDGHIRPSSGSIKFSSVSRKIIYQLQILLLSLGFLSVRRCAPHDNKIYKIGGREFKSNYDSWRLTLRQRDSFLLCKFLGISPPVSILPDSKEKVLLTIEEINTLIGINVHQFNNKNIFYCVRSKYEDIYNSNEYNMFVKNGLVIDEIAKIEHFGSKHVYDLEVNNHHHTYIANGFITHNTISLLPEVTSGIEPLFAKAYKAQDNAGTRYYIHPQHKEILEAGGKTPKWFVDSYDIKPIDHFEMQVAVQKYTDSAVSKTINLPKGTTKKKLSNYLLEYIRDLKGVTVYVDGCRGEQPLTRLSDAEAKKVLDKAATVKVEEEVQCKNGTCEL